MSIITLHIKDDENVSVSEYVRNHNEEIVKVLCHLFNQDKDEVSFRIIRIDPDLSINCPNIAVDVNAFIDIDVIKSRFEESRPLFPRILPKNRRGSCLFVDMTASFSIWINIINKGEIIKYVIE